MTGHHVFRRAIEGLVFAVLGTAVSLWGLVYVVILPVVALAMIVMAVFEKALSETAKLSRSATEPISYPVVRSRGSSNHRRSAAARERRPFVCRETFGGFVYCCLRAA